MRTLSIVMGALLLQVVSSLSFAATFAEIATENTRAVVYLEVRDSEGRVASRATGFIVSHDGHVVTVAHLNVTPTQKLFAIVGQTSGTSFPLTLLDRDEAVDVAIWRFPQSPICRTAATISSKSLNLLDPVLALGFPTNSGFTASTLAITNLQTQRGFLKTDGFLEPGNSGGPVFNQSGQVVGIVHGGGTPGTENNEIIPIGIAISLLRKWNVPAAIDTPLAYAERCFASCSSPQHGIASWTTEAPWGRSSGWLGGGNNQSGVCNGLASAVQAEMKADRVVVQSTSEEFKKDILGRVEYRYHCRGIFQRGPIYLEKRSSACGLQN